MASLIDPGSKIDVCKVDINARQSCGDFLGNTLPCTISPGYRGNTFLFWVSILWQTVDIWNNNHKRGFRFTTFAMRMRTFCNTVPKQVKCYTAYQWHVDSSSRLFRGIDEIYILQHVLHLTSCIEIFPGGEGEEFSKYACLLGKMFHRQVLMVESSFRCGQLHSLPGWHAKSELQHKHKHSSFYGRCIEWRLCTASSLWVARSFGSSPFTTNSQQHHHRLHIQPYTCCLPLGETFCRCIEDMIFELWEQ